MLIVRNEALVKYWVATEKVEASTRIPGTDGLSAPILVSRNIENAVYHISGANGKLLCGISPTWAMKLAGSKGYAFTTKRPLQLDCCQDCESVYLKSDSAELRRLRAWNSGKAKMFATELEAGSKYGKQEQKPKAKEPEKKRGSR